MKVAYREILPSDLEVIFAVRVRTWHNANGAEEMRRMGITHESVVRMMAKTHRGGWRGSRFCDGQQGNRRAVGDRRFEGV